MQVQTTIAQAVTMSFEGELYNLSTDALIAKVAAFGKKEQAIRSGLNPLFRACIVKCYEGSKTTKEITEKAMHFRTAFASSLGNRYAVAWGKTAQHIIASGLPCQNELEKIDFFMFETPKKADSRKEIIHGVNAVLEQLKTLADKKTSSKNDLIKKEGKAYAFLYNILLQNRKDYE